MPSPLASPLDAAAGPLGPMPPPQQTTPDLSNYNAANAAMKLSPQEQNLYQMHLTNLYGLGGVDNPPTPENPQGSRSTLFQATVEVEGKTFVIPTVWGGKIVPPDQALELAKQYGLEKFPSYDSEEAAQSRYDQMHGYMEQDTGAYLRNRGQ